MPWIQHFFVAFFCNGRNIYCTGTRRELRLTDGRLIIVDAKPLVPDLAIHVFDMTTQELPNNQRSWNPGLVSSLFFPFWEKGPRSVCPTLLSFYLQLTPLTLPLVFFFFFLEKRKLYKCTERQHPLTPGTCRGFQEGSWPSARLFAPEPRTKRLSDERF